MSNTVFDGQNLLSVAPDEFTFYREAISSARTDNVFYVETDYPSGWRVDRIVDAANRTTPVTWVRTTSNGVTALTSGAANTNTRVVLAVTANSGAERSAIIWIAVGRLRYAVNVAQTNTSGAFTLTTNAAASYPLDGRSNTISVTANFPWKITSVTDTYGILQNGSSLIGMTGQNNNISFTMARQDPAISKQGRPAGVIFEQQGGLGNMMVVVSITADEDLYVGRLGGQLVKAGGVWQYERPLYVQKKNAATNLAWSPTFTETGVTDRIQGKANTLALNLMSATEYPAANYCFQMNENYTDIRNVSDPDYVWFLPSPNQLMAVWTVRNSFDSADRPSYEHYWSSAENSVNQASGENLNTYYRFTGVKNLLYFVRCVRE